MSLRPVTKRRLVALGLAAAVLAPFQLGPRLADWWRDDFDFTPIPDLPGFRRLAGGEVSVAQDVLVGLDTARPIPNAAIAAARVDPWRALHPDAADPPRALRVASFSDYYCPYCRVLTTRLLALADAGEIAVSWHETPIFGTASQVAARAALAAGMQGRYGDFHLQMMRTPVRATPAFMAELAARIGLDVPRFTTDMQSAEITQALVNSAAIARVFGFVGTPALVVGRTALQGAISETNLRQLIAVERAAGQR